MQRVLASASRAQLMSRVLIYGTMLAIAAVIVVAVIELGGSRLSQDSASPVPQLASSAAPQDVRFVMIST